ncbi:MAG: RNA methyltransferase, partial [Clostridia bacterium]|nr:RNA methyltransferase [Clostridia bacterium]
KGIGLLKSIVKLSGTTDNEILGKWEKQLQGEFDEMIRSVETNKGFYVGRYECSLTDDKTKIQSIKGKTSATAAASSCNTWYGLYQKNKEYSLKNEKLKDVVGSSMIWGSQYDQMMIWMKKNGYDVTSTTPKTGVSYNTSQTTGKENDPDVLNNVYDLLGCNSEWTLDAFDTSNRVYRRR